MDGFPKKGSIVVWHKAQYEVQRHGCATYWPDCPNGARALTLLRLGGRHGQTECVSADKVSPT